MPTKKRIDMKKAKKAALGGKKSGPNAKSGNKVVTRPTLPWSQHPEESGKKYAIFCAYRDMGPGRSLRKLEVAGVTISGELKKYAYASLGTWSSVYDWNNRAGAYDRELDKQRQRAVRESARKGATRHAKLALLAQKIAWKVLKVIMRELNQNIDRISKMDGKDLMDMYSKVARLLSELQKVDRLALGEPTEILDHSGGEGLFNETGDFMKIIRNNEDALELWGKMMRIVNAERAKVRQGETQR